MPFGGIVGGDAMPLTKTVDDLGEEMLGALRAEAEVPEGVPGFIVWGETPGELETALYDLLKHLEEPYRTYLRRVLVDLVDRSREEGYTVLALLPTEEGVYAKGARVSFRTLPVLQAQGQA